MTSLKSVAAVALLSALAASPVFAQAAISEPGEFSFYHPDRDVLNGGKPLSEEVVPYSAQVEPYSASQAYAAMPGRIAVHHVRHHRLRNAAH